SPPTAFRGGRAVRELAAAAVVDETWNQRALAGGGTRAQDRVLRVGASRSRIHRQLVAGARLADPFVDGADRDLRQRGGLRGRCAARNVEPAVTPPRSRMSALGGRSS